MPELTEGPFREPEVAPPHDAGVTATAGSPSPPRAPGMGFLALAGTFLWPGLGHALVGRLRRGIFWFLVTGLVNLAVLALLLRPRMILLAMALPVCVILVLWVYADAFVAGRRARPRWGGAAGRFLFGGGLIVLGILLSPTTELALWFRDRYAESFAIQSRSMAPALEPGDKVLVCKGVPIRRWDMVVFRHPEYEGGLPIVFRVAGLPGETIEIHDDSLLVNGQPTVTPEGVGPYRSIPQQGHWDVSRRGQPCNGCAGNPITLRNSEYFVLGDASGIARDARLWEIPAGDHQPGALPSEAIVGRVAAIYWPPSRWRDLP